MTDTIADLINRLMNAKRAGIKSVIIPFSRVKEAICQVLRNEGYIGAIKIDKDQNQLIVDLTETKKEFQNIVRLSKPGRRIYVKSNNIPRPKGGYGMVVISTPQGVISGQRARKNHLGGEVICEVY